MNMKKKIASMVKEEFDAMLKEAEEQAPSIQKKLEEMRKKLEPDMPRFTSLGEETFNGPGARPMRKVAIKTVSEITGVPINELVMYFMNEVKNSNDRHLVEYRLGTVVFYASDK